MATDDSTVKLDGIPEAKMTAAESCTSVETGKVDDGVLSTTASPTSKGAQSDSDLNSPDRKSVPPVTSEQIGGQTDGTPTRREKIHRQVHYYMSDVNMRYDNFFQDKIALFQSIRAKHQALAINKEGEVESEKEPTSSENSKSSTDSANVEHPKAISANLDHTGEPVITVEDIMLLPSKEEWLELKYVVGSPRLKAMSALITEIIEAVGTSDCLYIVKDSKEQFVIRRNSPLPELVKRAPKETHVPMVPYGPLKSHHVLGDILMVERIPEEITSWQKVKDAFREKLPEIRVKHVTPINQQGAAGVWLSRVPGAKESIRSLKIVLEGEEVTLRKMTEKEASSFVSSLPPMVKNYRDKDLQQLRRIVLEGPLKLADTTFKSLSHLKDCVKDLMNQTAPGESLSEVAVSAVRNLLHYHPKAFYKLGGMESTCVGIKVDFHEKTDQVTGERVKSFFSVLKDKESGDITEKDFSIQKCIGELCKNPPIDESVSLDEYFKDTGDFKRPKRENSIGKHPQGYRNKRHRHGNHTNVDASKEEVSTINRVSAEYSTKSGA